MTTHAQASPVVDVHAHLVPRPLLEQLHRGALDFPSIEVTPHESTFRVALNGATSSLEPANRHLCTKFVVQTGRSRSLQCYGERSRETKTLCRLGRPTRRARN